VDIDLQSQYGSCWASEFLPANSRAKSRSLVRDTESPLLFHHSSASTTGAPWQENVAD